jgi:hypothetical protein
LTPRERSSVSIFFSVIVALDSAGGTGNLIDLKTYVVANGALCRGTNLEVAHVSLDGQKIIGHSFASEHGCPITPSCAADVTPAGGNGVVNIDDLLLVINSWNATGSNPPT